LHPLEQEWIKDNAAVYAKQQGISVDQAISDLTAQADRQVQNGSPGAWNQSASTFLDQARGMLPADGSSGPGYMFYATLAQKADASMYAGYYPNGVGPNQPSAQQIQNSASREQANRNLIGGGVIAAATSGVLVAGAPAPAPAAAAVGGLGYAVIGASAGGGMDAAGQYAQTGTIRLAESVLAATTGAVAGPIGANVGFISNVLLGAAGSGVNTAFNNAFYGETNSLSFASGLGAFSSAIAFGIGAATTKGLSQI
jgi:filamentous hemagglutinin